MGESGRPGSPFFCVQARARYGAGGTRGRLGRVAEQAAEERGRGAWLEQLPVWRERPILRVLVTCVMCVAALALRQAADGLLPPGFPFVTFFPVVIVTSFLFGAVDGAVAAMLCGVFAWYFFVPVVNSIELAPGAPMALAFYVFVVTTDVALVHWMQRATARVVHERAMSARLAETRELLFRELQHRVSNNLQVAAALLALQRRQIVDKDARQALDQAARRLGTIGRLSRQLYDTDGQSRDLSAFLDALCADVIEASGRQGIRCTFTSDGTVALDQQAAIPLALIVAEAVANALEHGFAGRDEGRISVSLVRREEEVVIDVVDNGHGLPPGFSLEASNSLGLRIATTLAQQIGGRFEMFGGNGTTSRLILPA